MRRPFVLAAVLVLVLASPALGSHAGQYARNPVEHDDQGRSDEPDFARTSVLGPALENRVLDLNLDGRAAPDGSLPPPLPGHFPQVAPGCTDDTGRQPSGMCGVCTIGAAGVVPGGVLGCVGTSMRPPPGAYSAHRDTVVRFLDVRADTQVLVPGGVTARLDVNHKVADAGLRGVVPEFLAGPVALWAWLGDWRDLNANGVIDHLAEPANGFAGNEFVWRGGCRTMSGAVNPGPHCVREPDAQLLGYAFPGTHTARCGALALFVCTGAGDVPGARALCLLDHAAYGFVTAVTQACAGSEPAGGDPILGEPGSVAPDDTFDDRTGEADIAVRGWFYGQGWSAHYYDQSLLVRHTFVAAYAAPVEGSPNRYRLADARFLDVDHHRALHPDVEALVLGVQATTSSGFRLLRGASALPSDAEQRVRIQVGPVDDALLHPGWSHEPNTALDRYPAALYQVHPPGISDPVDAAHHGWRNDYTAHAQRPRAWADVQSVRELAGTRPVVGGGLDLFLVSGPGLTTTVSPEPMPANVPRRDHARSLGPGLHHFVGNAGLWHDLPQWSEDVALDPFALRWVTTRTATAPDYWVGNLLNFTNLNHGTDRCTISGLTTDFPWEWCHPYLDGAVDDPNDYGAAHGEWQGGCGGTSFQRSYIVELHPEGGRWTVPVFAWRSTFHGIDLLRPGLRLEDHTGTEGPLRLAGYCFDSGRLLGLDAVLLPAGNAGLRVTSILTLDVRLGGAVERVVDVDVYEPLGA